jgi:tRNA(Leu) C34 or U34 (ribose-2'-O)-methylase TrmL
MLLLGIRMGQRPPLKCLMVVKRATIVARHRQIVCRHWVCRSMRRPGRPRPAPQADQLVPRLARGSAGWGCGKAVGEMRKLTFTSVGRVHGVAADGCGEHELSLRHTRGADAWVETEYHAEPGTCLARVTEAELAVCCAALEDRSVDYRDAGYTRPCAVAFGNELFGPSRTWVELADPCIMVPMMGMVQSLNVSAAAAMVLYETLPQRQAAGMHPHSELAPAQPSRLFRCTAT